MRIRANIELGYFADACALLLPILKASSAVETLDALVEGWLTSDTNYLIDFKMRQLDPSKAVAYSDNSKALVSECESRRHPVIFTPSY